MLSDLNGLDKECDVPRWATATRLVSVSFLRKLLCVPTFPNLSEPLEVQTENTTLNPSYSTEP